MKVEGVDPEQDTFLALDLSSNVGWCVMLPGGYQTGEECFKPPRRLSDYRIWLTEAIKTWRPAIIFIEDIFINPHPSTKTLLHMHGVTLEVLENFNALWQYVGQSSAKAYVAHDGKMTAKAKKAGAMVRALQTLHGLDVTGIDEADALAVALTGMRDVFYPGRKRM